jgi:hypothetical protein
MKQRSSIRIVSWAQIIGGIAGLALLPLIPTQQARMALPDHLRMPAHWYVFAFLAFAVSIIAGEFLRRGHRYGRPLSIAVQAAQVFRFSTAAFVYQFATGLELLLFLNRSEVRFSPGVRATFSAMPPLVQEPWSIGVNIFAIIALVVLIRSAHASGMAPAPAPAV